MTLGRGVVSAQLTKSIVFRYPFFSVEDAARVAKCKLLRTGFAGVRSQKGVKRRVKEVRKACRVRYCLGG